jgi:hypothetical protein
MLQEMSAHCHHFARRKNPAAMFIFGAIFLYLVAKLIPAKTITGDPP